MYESARSLPDELQTDEIFIRVLEELEHVNADEKMRAILEQRDKEERTRLTELNAALKKGREEGRQEGREEGRKEGREGVARKMLGMGLETSLISQATELSIEEIEKIRATIKPG